jgi:hypothetical protein
MDRAGHSNVGCIETQYKRSDNNAIDFTMVSDTGKTVRCMVSQAAIDDLARHALKAPIKPAPVDRLGAFLKWQDEIEKVASDKYDALVV